MPGLLVAAVPNLDPGIGSFGPAVNFKGIAASYLGHRKLALKAPPNSVVDTLGLAPRLLHAMVSVGLMAPVNNSSLMLWIMLGGACLYILEGFCALLDNRNGHFGERANLLLQFRN